MKKYNVYELFVIGINKNFKKYYFLCSQDSMKNYREIFTNKKIIKENIISTEPLCDYYSLFSQCTYKTGKPLMLTTSDLITKYVDINNLKQDKEKRY